MATTANIAATIPLEPAKLWEPAHPEKTNMERFRLHVNNKFGLSLANYVELWQWSTTSIADFWSEVWHYTGVISSQQWDNVIDTSVPMDQIPVWFRGAMLNFAENLLWCRSAEKLAVIVTGEGQTIPRKLTYADLYEQVRLVAAAMRNAGIVVGDRIAAYIPNCPEAIIAMLAAVSIGAVWSSTSPDFGPFSTNLALNNFDIPQNYQGVLDRFSQIQPRILFTVNAVVYNGRAHDHLEKVKAVVDGLSTLEKVVIIPFVATHTTDGVPKSELWSTFVSTTSPTAPLTFAQLPFNHPAFILFSSGTTGKPKCIVHSAGGLLLQLKKEHVIHGDLLPDDVFFYYTTTGWMMWNWLTAGLAVGATIVLFDGSPFKPGPGALWELGLVELWRFNDHHNLSTLRAVYSTGSPLKPESFDFVYSAVKKDVLLGSITGGTDICSLFAGHNAALPVYRGEIQCRCLGMKIEAWDGQGEFLKRVVERCTVCDFFMCGQGSNGQYGMLALTSTSHLTDKPVYGQSADLVCTVSFPCMPVYMFDDADRSKYTNAYFAVYPSVWYHGDFVWMNPGTGGVVMLGRSDGTLNPAGVRFGSAEIYNVVDKFADDVEDSLCVGQKLVGMEDERVVLFLKMRDGRRFDDALAKRIKSRIRDELSARHVPVFVLEIMDIPHTINGKKVEVAVKKIISGQTVAPSGTLANPDSLQLYYNIPELQQA
ncbi:acetoacetate-CoA ligase [Jimgerdemannia flammicorona]|uniref:Acetoacetate-CoA ligase n=1 Tax=Jimgerdemannia flammicorona TaxID=994334 RepID=A0A433QNB9_9FUNG|nr:acetoacetate-CoA ligase [Jimgerdemannia flammicorona]